MKKKLNLAPQKYKNHETTMNNYMPVKRTTWKNGQFLRKVQSPSTEPGRIENMNRSITNTEIGTRIKGLPTNKSPGPNGFTGKFYPTFREELKPVLKLILKITEEGKLPNSFYEATITLISKPDKARAHARTHTHTHTHTHTLQVNVTDEHRCRNPQQITSNM